MKLVCSQNELNTALQLVSRAVSARPTHPVLANILLTADAGTGRLTLTGFDLNLGIQTVLKATVDKSGAITLPAKLFCEIISKLSNESPVTLISDENGDQVELESSRGSYQMRGISADEFPDLPLVQSVSPLKLKANNLLTSLRSTLFASSNDEAKQLLTGVHLSFESSHIESAATDGHRLAVMNIKNSHEENNSEPSYESKVDEKFSVTLPSRSLKEVERLISNWSNNEIISLFCEQGQVVILGSNQVVTTRTLEGTYPNYRQLIPEKFIHNLKINRKDLISSLERIGVLADQHNNVVKLSPDSSSSLLKLTAEAQDVGSGAESIPLQFSGESFEIAFNVKYLLDGIKILESEYIYFKCNSPTTPAILVPDIDNNEFTYLIMPVQTRP